MIKVSYCAVLFTCAAGLPVVAAAAEPIAYFAIQVVDDQTGRGVPLVQLQTTNNILHHTDSNGMVAFHEPGVMGRDVFFHVLSHGYEYPKDGFGMRGLRLKCEAGGSATIKIKRINIAERLYRVTGGGLYRDTVLLGRKAPLAEPAINALVFGCDSVSTVEHRGRLFWLWGDTNRPAYPLGNFHTTCATSAIPGKGGLDQEVGVDLKYFENKDGFTKEMSRFSEKGPTWLDSLIVLNDQTGSDRLYSAYANVNTKMETQERGLCIYNDEKEVFEKLVEFPLKAPVLPGGHPFRHTLDGVEYIYFAHSLPLKRVKATAAALAEPQEYEAFTCLTPGSRVEDAKIDRNADGRIRYAWKRNTPALAPQEERKLVEAGKLQPQEALIQLQDADTGKPMLAHAGSVYWNEFRKRWIYIVCEFYGTSVLGETWYTEADTPLGPWVYARKIVTHDTYSFYNPKQHPNFAKQNGRILFFEGTYTHTFSGNTVQTPRYDYNQIMYKLDLADSRLVLPVPVYALGNAAEPGAFATAEFLPAEQASRAIAFFAPDRSAPGLLAVKRDAGEISSPIRALTAEPPKPGTSSPQADVLFYALPADAKDPPATTLPLFEYTRQDDGRKVWTTNDKWSVEGFRRTEKPLCRVWKNPTSLTYPLD